MHLLYDSDTFCVTHMSSDLDLDAPQAKPQDAVSKAAPHPLMVRHGFEIVDKRSGKEVYLDGSWAELFQQRLQAWQRKAPTQDEVEDTLAQYAELAQMPVVVH